MAKYITYLRVSTQRQGASGLGLEAQRKMCADFIAHNNGEHVAEYVDVESGTHRNRKGLWDAIERCKREGCELVIAKLDRLARDVEFTFKVINTGIAIHFTDMPVVNSMILGVFAAVAQYERELTSNRTKKALEAKKRQGYQLGSSSQAYRDAMAAKSDDERKASRAKAGATRTRRVAENRDTRAMIQIMRSVFPLCAQRKVEEWTSDCVCTKREFRVKFFAMMADYKRIDQDIFRDWDLSDVDDAKLAHKLAAKLQSILKIICKGQLKEQDYE